MSADEKLSLADGWISQARKVPSPNYNARPSGTKVSMIVVHNISLPPGCFGGDHIESLFTNCLDPSIDPFFEEIAGLEVSAHFLIRRDGELVQFVSANDRAWHAGVSSWCGREGCNDFSVGIELEGADDISYSDAQYAVLVNVIEALRAEYSEISLGDIVGHSDIAPGRKTDPGEAFDWGRLKRSLRS